jgi:hypothetical protein
MQHRCFHGLRPPCVSPSPRHHSDSNVCANSHFADIVEDFGLLLFNFGASRPVRLFQN